MTDFWFGVGIALIILALAIGLRSCSDDRPMFGVNGFVVNTGYEAQP